MKTSDPSCLWLQVKPVRFAAVGLILFALICPLPEAVQSDPWTSAAMDGLHVPAFAGLTLLLRRLLVRSNLLFVAMASVAIAGAVEVIQDFTGRSPSWTDFALGIFGTLMIPWGHWLQTRCHQNVAGVAIVVPALLLSGLPLYAVAAGRTCLARDLPRLGFSPERGWASAWQPQDGSLTNRIRTQSGCGLLVEASAGSYRGVSFLPGSQDWSAYRELELRIWNPGGGFPLGLRIEDQQSGKAYRERFNGVFEIPHGRSKHSLSLDEVAAGPSDRLLDLHRIRRIALFTGENEPARTFVLEEAILR